MIESNESMKEGMKDAQAAFTGDKLEITESRIYGFTDLWGPVALTRTRLTYSLDPLTSYIVSYGPALAGF